MTPAVIDQDLVIYPDLGIAQQIDPTYRVEVPYFEKCGAYEGQEIARKINAGRVALVDKYVGSDGWILDIGVGSGEFIKNRPQTWGYDVDPHAAEWLMRENRWATREMFGFFDAYTMWDVIEHLAEPEEYFERMPHGTHLFACLPIFDDLARIRESRHYRPGEHLIYFSELGFVNWMKGHRFEHLETQDFETTAGRDSILSFAFRKT